MDNGECDFFLLEQRMINRLDQSLIDKFWAILGDKLDKFKPRPFKIQSLKRTLIITFEMNL